MGRVILSEMEHNGFVHLCGRTGDEVKVMGDFCWSTCEILRECLLNHCQKPADLLSDERFKWTVDRLWLMARGVK